MAKSIRQYFPIDADSLRNLDDSSFATQDNVLTMTNKTLTAPIINDGAVINYGQWTDPKISGTINYANTSKDIGDTNISNGIIYLPKPRAFFGRDVPRSHVYNFNASESSNQISTVGVGTKIIIKFNVEYTWSDFTYLDFTYVTDTKWDTQTFYPGDVLELYEYAAGYWRALSIERFSGYPTGFSMPKGVSVGTSFGNANVLVITGQEYYYPLQHKTTRYTISVLPELVNITLADSLAQYETQETYTWYYIWDGLDSLGNRIKRLSKYWSAPTEFEYYTLLGAAYHTTGGAFLQFSQINNKVTWLQEIKPVTSSTVNTTWTKIGTPTGAPKPPPVFVKNTTWALASINIGVLSFGISHNASGQYASFSHGSEYTGSATDMGVFSESYQTFQVLTIPKNPTSIGNYYYWVNTTSGLAYHILNLGFEYSSNVVHY